MSIRVGIGALVVSVLLVACGGRSGEQGSASSETQEETSSERAAPGDAAAEAGGGIEIPPEVQDRLGLVVTPATQTALRIDVEVTGSVQPIERRLAQVRPLARGRIEDVFVAVGDQVSRGRTLARFDNIEAGELASDYDAARAELARLRVQLGTAIRQADRARRLAEIGAVPQRESEVSLGEQQQLEAAIQAQESTLAGLEVRLRRFGTPAAAEDRSSASSISSPLSGIVIRMAVAPGDVVDPSSELFVIADISRVYVQANVFEKDLGRVHDGQVATVTVDAYPGERFEGKVAAIGGTVDARTRTIPVRVEVANHDARLKLDMFARVAFPSGATEGALTVPAEAVQIVDGRSVVFVKVKPSVFAPRPVQTGRASGDLIEITAGLTVGDAVVSTNAFRVKSAMFAGRLGDDDDAEK